MKSLLARSPSPRRAFPQRRPPRLRHQRGRRHGHHLRHRHQPGGLDRQDDPAGARPRGIQLTADGKRLYVALSDIGRRTKSPGGRDRRPRRQDLQGGRALRRGQRSRAVRGHPRRLPALRRQRGRGPGHGDRRQKEQGDRLAGGGHRARGGGPEPRRPLGLRDGRDQQHRLGDRHPHAPGGLRPSWSIPARASPPSRRTASGPTSPPRSAAPSTVVDAVHHKVLRTIKLPPRAKPVGVVVSPDGKRIYVANGHGNSVSVIDAATETLPPRSRWANAPGGSPSPATADGSTPRTASATTSR